MKSLTNETVKDLYELLKVVTQFSEKIEELRQEVQKHSNGEIVPYSILPPSVIDTGVLASVFSGYTFMYNAFLEHELIKSGQPKYKQKVH